MSTVAGGAMVGWGVVAIGESDLHHVKLSRNMYRLASEFEALLFSFEQPWIMDVD